MESKPKTPETPETPETSDAIQKYLPAGVAAEDIPKLKLTRAQLKSIGIKRKEPPSEKQQIRNEAAANRFREMHKKQKEEKLAAEAGRVRDFEEKARVKIAEKERKPYTKRPKVKLAPIPPEPDSDTESSEEAEYVVKKAKKASRTASAIAKLDQRIARVAQPYTNPYLAAMMRR
jgi:hypothetical protein